MKGKLTVVNLKWFLLCLLPIGLIAMIGCSPPKSAQVSQATSTPTVPAVESKATPAAGTTSPPAEAPVASAPSGNSGDAGMMAQRMPEYDPEAEAARIAKYNAAQPGNRNNNSNDSDKDNEGDDSGADSETAEPDLPPFPGPSGKTGTEVGDLIPEIKGKDIDKKSFTLSDYSGRVVMIDFWGDW